MPFRHGAPPRAKSQAADGTSEGNGDVSLPDPDRAVVWFSNPDMVYVNPNEDGVSMGG
jgi:hypothetical protein